jgi:hypothetical protein
MARGKFFLAHSITTVQLFLLILSDQRLCIVRNMHIHIYVYIYTHIQISDHIETAYELPLLPNNTVNEIFLIKSGDVWSVNWVFIILAPAWSWLGEYVTLDITFYSLLLKQEKWRLQLLPHCLPYDIPRRCLYYIYNVMLQCINYIIIIFINNNAVINNTLWKTPKPRFGLQNSHGHRKGFFRNLWPVGARILKTYSHSHSRLSCLSLRAFLGNISLVIKLFSVRKTEISETFSQIYYENVSYCNTGLSHHNSP